MRHFPHIGTLLHPSYREQALFVVCLSLLMLFGCKSEAPSPVTGIPGNKSHVKVRLHDFPLNNNEIVALENPF